MIITVIIDPILITVCESSSLPAAERSLCSSASFRITSKFLVKARTIGGTLEVDHKGSQTDGIVTAVPRECGDNQAREGYTVAVSHNGDIRKVPDTLNESCVCCGLPLTQN